MFKATDLQPTEELLLIILNDPIQVGDDYILEIAFSGIMNDKIVGLYSSKYLDEDGNGRFVLDLLNNDFKMWFKFLQTIYYLFFDHFACLYLSYSMDSPENLVTNDNFNRLK